MASLEDLTEEQRNNIVKRATVLQKLLDNPEVSEEVKRAIMKTDKSVRFSEVIAKDEVSGTIKEQSKKIEELEQKMIQENAERNLERRHAEARERGLDPADVEKAIVERGIGKWDTAMEFVELSQRSAIPTPSSFNPGNSTEIPDDKEFYKNPQQWATNKALEVIDELRGRRPPLRAVK
jgi:hypothetical protein